MPSLPYWLFPGDDRPPAEIDDEVAEELRLHLDLLAEERMRQGVAPDQAKQQAAERFGDYDTLLRRCRLEKQGEIPMLKRIQAVLTLLLLLVVVWLGVRDYMTASTTAQYMTQTTTFLTTIQGDLAELRGDLQLAEAGPTSNESNDPTPLVNAYQRDEEAKKPVSTIVLVRDEKGDPLPGATVFATHLRQGKGVNHLLTVLDDGRAEWLQALEPEDQPIFYVGAVAPGYVATTSGLDRDRYGDHAVTLALKKASPFELRVTKADGTPADYMSVIPTQRTDQNDRSHGFPRESRELWQHTDAEGCLIVDWLAPSDLATVLLKQRGKPIDSATTVEFEAPRDPSKVVSITLTETGRSSRYGGGEFGGRGGGFRDRSAYEVQVGEEADEPTEKPSRRRGRGGGQFGGGDFGGGEFGGGGFGGSVKDDAATRIQDLLEKRELILEVLQQEQAELSKAQRAVDTAMQARVAKAERASGVAVKQRDAAKAKLTAASTDYERTKELFAEGLTSELKSQLAEQRRREADAALAAASAAVADAESKLLADRNAQLASSKGYEAQIQKIQASIRKAETEVTQAKLELLKAQASSEESDKTKANESQEGQ